MASSTEEGWDEGDSSEITMDDGTGVTETTGLLGAGAMWLAMRLIEQAGPPTGGMVVAVGSLLTKSRVNALSAGILVYLGAAVVFGLLYMVLMMRLQITAWPYAFFAGAGFGFFSRTRGELGADMDRVG